MTPARIGEGWWRTAKGMWAPVFVLHKIVAIANLACLAGALIFLIRMEWSQPFGLAYYLGYFANVAAVLIGLILTVYVLSRAVQGYGRQVWRRHWLGVFNGLAVVFAWSPLWGLALYRSLIG